ncbi:MAG TPA: DUF4439 domain-containing protein [Mycobacteriales bacterium]|nr:DUF4439 domain-containing protein [Mycobacteriales bacterium]
MTLTRRQLLALPALASLARPAAAAAQTATGGTVAAQTATGGTAALRAALALEHEAGHTFPELGARVDEATKELIRDLDADHRRQRDRLIEELVAAGDEPAAALPAYSLPLPVIDRSSALDVLLLLEEALVRAYAEVVTRADRAGHRSLAAELLARCATHQTSLRFARARSLVDATDPLPGG